MGLCYSVPNVSNGTGANPSDRLALLPTETIVDESDTGRMTVGDEMDLLMVARTPMPLGKLNWSDAQPSTTKLMTIPVHPLVSSRQTTDTSLFALPTYLAYIAYAFKFWRGSIRYRFEVVATQHHTGRLIVAWIPNDSYLSTGYPIADGLDINSLTQYPCEIFDLALNKEFEFVVPYNSPTRYKKMPQFSPFNQVSTDTVNNSDYSLGNLVLMIQNTLTHPGTVANNVDINVFVSGGDDFELRSACPQFTATNTNVIFQSGTVSLEGTRSGEADRQDSKIGVSPSGVGTDTTQGPARETHLKFLLSRYFPANTFAQAIQANDSILDIIYSSPVYAYPTYEAGSCSSDLLSYFGRLYRFWTGGLNHMFIHSSTVNQPIFLHTDHNPDYDFATTTDGVNGLTYLAFTQLNEGNDLSNSAFYTSVHNLRVNPTVSVTTPFRSIYPKLLTETPSIAASGLDDAGRAFTTGVLRNKYFNSTADTITLRCEYFRGAGDDFRLFYLINPPKIRLGTA